LRRPECLRTRARLYLKRWTCGRWRANCCSA
jgi:hypothetical protein